MYQQALYKLASPRDDEDDDEVSPLTGLGMLGAGAGAMYAGRKMLSDEDINRLDRFSSAISTPNSLTPGQAIQNYAIHGSDAAKVRPFGVNTVDAIKNIRTTAADAISGVNKVVPTGVDPDIVSWKGDDSAAHYREFAKGPVAAYRKLVDEWRQSGRGWEAPGSFNSGHGVRDTVRELQYADEHNTPYQVPTGVLPKSSLNPANLKIIQAEGDRIRSEAARLQVPISMPQQDFDQKLDASFSQLAGTRFGTTNTAELSQEQQAELLRAIDAHLQSTDPKLYIQKQIVDMTAGQPYKGKSLYGPLADGMSTSAKVLRYGGLALAAAGIGVGMYALYRLLTKRKPQHKTAELSEPYRKAIKYLLVGGALAGAGYGAYRLLSPGAKPAAPAAAPPAAPAVPPTVAPEVPARVPATTPTPEPPATTTTTIPASAPTVVPATPKLDPKIEQFKQHWDSMPEWRRARAFKSLQNEIGDPSQFKELGWIQRQKLKLMAGKEADQYGPNYGPVASFVLDNQDPELIRQAYQVASQNQGRDY